MRTLVQTILFTVLCVTTSSAETKSLYDELSVKGYELLLDMRYDEADKIFDEMIRMEPKNAMGYVCKSQSYFHYWQYAMIEPDQKDLEQFKELLFSTRNIAKEMLDKDKDNIDALFILGSAYGNIGLYYGNTDNWFRAWWNARKGIKYIKKVVKEDPEYYNAYLLLGMYNYFADTLPRFVKALSFLLGRTKGDREKGIDQLILASSKADLKGDAKIFLADSVYFNEENYEAASLLLEELKAEYPDNHYLSLILAVSYRHLNKLDLSVQTLKSSLQ
jgi:tetratricopeptide (TPR) repeat protein